MKGSGRFGSDAKQRLAARQVSLKREKNKASRERAFSSPPSRTVNDVVNPISVEGASSIAGAYASRGLQKGIKSSIGQGLLGPIVGRIANYLIPENNKPIKDMTTQERKAEAYNALELPPIVGDAASIARVMEDINREGISPRTLARGGVDIGLSILNPVGGAATIKNVAKGIVNDVEINSASAKMLDEIDELLGVVDEPTKAGVTKATKTTGFKLPDPDPTTGRIEPFDIGSDEIVTNTDFQAASLGIHHGQKTDDKVASAAMDELNASLGKNLKENKEGYRVYMDPVIPEGSSLARVIRQRFNVLDKDGRERFIQARVKDGYSEKDAANLWKGLGSKTDEELENWWTSFRQNNPEIPWDIQAINSEKHPDLWAHVGGIDFDHVFSAAGKNGTGKLENFVPIGHYLNRMKGKMDGPEFLDYLAQNKPAIFEYLGGYDGPYAKSLAPAINAKRRTQPKTAPIPILGNAFKDYMRQLQGK